MKDGNMDSTHPPRGGTSSHQHPWWTVFRSIWRLKIVGFLVMTASFFWLQYYHFQFGMPVSAELNKRVVGIPENDDDDDDNVNNSANTKVTTDAIIQPRTPCPFQSPKITGFKNWILYPKESFDGLSLLRPQKESILLTAFPGCVPFVLAKQVRENTLPLSTLSLCRLVLIFCARLIQKLLLFTVLKVSSTVFTQVAKRLDGIPNWSNGCGNVQNPVTTNLTYLTDVPPKYAEQLLLDPEWTKAIFVRDPKERVLSAYLNKAVGETSYIKTRCCNQNSEDVHVLLECHDPESLVSVHQVKTCESLLCTRLTVWPTFAANYFVS